MKKIFNIATLFLLVIIGPVLTSCVYDDGDFSNTSSQETQVGMNLRIPMKATNAVGHEVGSAEENYVDIQNGNFRIYFFGTDNKFIAKFTPKTIKCTEGSNYKEYDVEGNVPTELIRETSFKMVVLANWNNYDDTQLIPGTTTIDDLCTADYAQFTYNNSFKLGQSNAWIPFFGVHEYTDVTFIPNGFTQLDSPVWLLRAMAKVELIMDNTEAECEYVEIQSYNPTGYCAPKVTDNFPQNGPEWGGIDIPIHLPGGENNDGAITQSRLFDKIEAQDETEKDRWVVYIPEYQNKGTGDKCSCIKVKLANHKEPYTIHFANYYNGITDNSDENRFDIQRNHLYRFHFDFTPLLFKVYVDEWVFGGKVHIEI